MRRLLATIILSLAVVASAAAGRGDPQKQITPADQARARAMVLRSADFGSEFTASKSRNEPNPYCAALDESDLVLTGEVDSPDFGAQTGAQVVSAGSTAQIYKTAAQSAQSWRRGMSTAGVACIRVQLGKVFKPQGIKLVSFRKLPFSRVAPGTVAYRGKLSYQGIGGTFDVVGLRSGRAQVGLFFLGVPLSYPRADEVRLAKLTAGRMATAMKGS